MDHKQVFALLQLTDSAFPIGGFSHSLGLEAYCQHQNAVSRKQMAPEVLLNALVCIIENSGSLSLPFVTAAHDLVYKDSALRSHHPQISPTTQTQQELNRHSTDNTEIERQQSDETVSASIESLVKLDKLYEASTTNHIARRSSTRQGRSLLEASLYTFPILRERGMDRLCADLPHCHHAVLHGAILGCLGLSLEDTVSSYMFGVARTLIATAVRLDVVGAMEALEICKINYSRTCPIRPPKIINHGGRIGKVVALGNGQKLQWKLQEVCADVVRRNKMRPVEQAAVKFPVLDVLQNTQDTLFAKLFYS